MKYKKLTKEYLDDLDKDQDHILVCQTPVVIPFSFISHTFILTKQKDEVNRYEVFGVSKELTQTHGCVFKNDLDPWEGMLYIFAGDIRKKCRRRFGATVIQHFNSQTTSNIGELVRKIDNEYLLYPFRYTYSYSGANSNTFTAWLLRHINLTVSLPWNAVGKDYDTQQR